MDSVLTGDVLLFTSNTATGFLLRTATSSVWNHVGIAIRLLPDKRVSGGSDGELYVLELNSGKRYDVLTDTSMDGMTLTEIKWVIPRYNAIAVRRLSSSYRTSKMLSLTASFISKNHGISFSQGLLPFISVWLGIPFAGENREIEGRKELFCSEMTAQYYRYCIKNNDFDCCTLTQLFGYNAPELSSLYIPEHFSSTLTPFSPIFPNKEEIIYQSYADPGIVLMQPLLIALFIMTIFSMGLPS